MVVPSPHRERASFHPDRSVCGPAHASVDNMAALRARRNMDAGGTRVGAGTNTWRVTHQYLAFPKSCASIKNDVDGTLTNFNVALIRVSPSNDVA